MTTKKREEKKKKRGRSSFHTSGSPKELPSTNSESPPCQKVSNMATQPELHLGFSLDFLPHRKVEVNLKGADLKAHTAIIAQSGSGKSFSLGRLLEEIASKTNGRILILDPNSDFVKFSKVNDKAWPEDANKRRYFSKTDSLENFKERMENVTFRVYTQREATCLGLPAGKAERAPVSIPWAQLTAGQRAIYLEVSTAEDAEAVSAITAATTIFNDDNFKQRANIGSRIGT
jgi:hypothetical protein